MARTKKTPEPTQAPQAPGLAASENMKISEKPMLVEFKDVNREYMTFTMQKKDGSDVSYTIYFVKRMGRWADGYVIVTENNEVYLINTWQNTIVSWKVPYGQSPLLDENFYKPY